MGDIEVTTEDLFSFAVSDSQVQRGLDFQELLSVVFGVLAGGVMEEEVEVVDCFEH